MSDSDLGKLNKYMGGTDDAAQFTTPVDGSGENKTHQTNDYSRLFQLVARSGLRLKLSGVGSEWDARLQSLEEHFSRGEFYPEKVYKGHGATPYDAIQMAVLLWQETTG